MYVHVDFKHEIMCILVFLLSFNICYFHDTILLSCFLYFLIIIDDVLHLFDKCILYFVSPIPLSQSHVLINHPCCYWNI